MVLVRGLGAVIVTVVGKMSAVSSCRWNLHGGTLPKLMAEKVSFGEWELPIRFEQTENGGNCSPGCHRPFAYNRKKAVNITPPEQSK